VSGLLPVEGFVGDDKSVEHRMVVKWAKSVSRVLQAGSVAAMAVIAARVLTGSGEFKVWEIDHVPLKAAWVVFLGLTIAHVFTAYFFRRAITDMGRKRSIEEQRAVYEDILVEGGLYISVAVRRIPQPGRRIVPMSPSDASTWVSHAGAVAAVIAVLPWWWNQGLRWPGVASSLVIASVAAVLVVVNWLVGGTWAIAVSGLGNEAAAERVDAAPPTPRLPSAVPVTAWSTAALTGSAAVAATFGSAGALGGLTWLLHALLSR
jgi:hypothetical protein